MVCPKCGGKVQVKDVMHNPTYNETYRRKTCTVCKHEFYTTEYEVEPTSDFLRDWTMSSRYKIDNRLRGDVNGK